MASDPSVLDYLEFSQLASDLTANGATVPFPAGFSVLSMQSDSSGMVVVAFINSETQQIVISYRDSVGLLTPGGVTDWIEDDLDDIALDHGGTIFPEALTFAQSLTTDSTYSGYTFFVTGHSLGGAEAQYVAANLGLGGVTFGAPGVSNLLPTGVSTSDPNLTDYVNQYDPIGNYAGIGVRSGNHVGNVQEIPNSTNNEIVQTGILLYGAPTGLNVETAIGYRDVAELAFISLEFALFHQLPDYASALSAPNLSIVGTIPIDPFSTLGGGQYEPIDLGNLCVA